MIPLVVDLDGTLLRTDVFYESILMVVRQNPFNLFRLPCWLFKGKAALKKQLADRISFDPSALPYNDALLSWLKEQKAAGRRLILCTGADSSIARPIAAHLHLFDEVMASDGITNLSRANKANALVSRFGEKGFDYAGNESADFPVWEKAHAAIVVRASARFIKKVADCCPVENVFSLEPLSVSVWVGTLRMHQYLKNALLFVALGAAHQLGDMNSELLLIVAFFSFSFCASSVYIMNDLLDIESDRLHPRKANRPFASCRLPVSAGLMLAPLLVLVSIALALFVNVTFLWWLMVYFVLTSAYSLGLKRLALIDCFVLAMLYTLRIVAGAAAVQVTMSFWLLAFSLFLFLSLSFVKRFAEIENQKQQGRDKIHGRGYHASDASLIQTLGVTAGFSSVLVLAFYLNSDTVIALYRSPQWVWGAVLVMLFWVSWVWMQASRAKMHDDPLVFALKDRTSLVAALVFLAILCVATVGSPW